MKARPQDGAARQARLAWFVLLSVALAWTYWPTFEQMVRRWSQDPQYTHGYVVPLFALIVLWFHRDHFPRQSIYPSWWGVPALLLGGGLRLAGTLFSFEWLEAGSLLPSVAGVVLLSFGPAVLRWGWSLFVFLLFILPWPWQLDVLLTYPLRRIATVCSTYALQTLGVPALARGNIIVVNELEVGVVEACSGLGMLMTFFALSTAVAFVIDRPWHDRLVIFFSAIPIGVMMNVLRITLTVFLYQVADPELARLVFHDVAGWVMMPMALVVLWLELLWLGWLWLPSDDSRPIPIPLGGPIGPRPEPTWNASVPVRRGRTSRPEEADCSLEEITDGAP
ncbi:MAG: exosortase/archaeosortase family protein [Gemmataceae bacterium]